jgi:hypothetical protein
LVLGAEIAAGAAELEIPVAGAVVGHDAGDGDAEAAVVGHGGFEEGGGALLLLVGHDLREGDMRGVINADMDKLPADAVAAARAAAVAGDPRTNPVEAAELFAIDMDHLAGCFALT